MGTRRFIWIVVTFAVCGLISALAVWSLLPFTPQKADPVVFVGQLLILCLVGPITFVWAWGPLPLNTEVKVIATSVPLLVISLVYVGYWRRRSRVLLVTSAAVWSIFGGISTYLAVTGSI